MSKFVALVCVCLLLIVVGCHEPAQQNSGNPRTSGSDTRPRDSWGVLKPVKDLAPFEGVWKGETFATNLVGESGKLKSGAELREDSFQKHRLTIEERRAQETWYRLQVSIERKNLDLGDSAPFGVDVIVETHAPDGTITDTSKDCQIRIVDATTLELRVATAIRPEYIVRLKIAKEDSQVMELKTTNLDIGLADLHKLEESPDDSGGSTETE